MHQHAGLRTRAQRTQGRGELIDPVHRRVLPQKHQAPLHGRSRQRLAGLQRLGVVGVGQRDLGGVVAQQRARRWGLKTAPAAARQLLPQGIATSGCKTQHAIVVRLHRHTALAGHGKHRGHGLPVLRHLRGVHRHIGRSQHHRHAPLQGGRKRRIVRRGLGCGKQHVDAQRQGARRRQGLHQLCVQAARQGWGQVQRRQAGFVQPDHQDARIGRRSGGPTGQQVMLQPLQRRPHRQGGQQRQQAQREQYPQRPGPPGVLCDRCSRNCHPAPPPQHAAVHAALTVVAVPAHAQWGLTRMPHATDASHNTYGQPPRMCVNWPFDRLGRLP